MSSLSVRALDYTIAIYPVFLTILSCILIEMHDRNFKLLVFIWRPFPGQFFFGPTFNFVISELYNWACSVSQRVLYQEFLLTDAASDSCVTSINTRILYYFVWPVIMSNTIYYHFTQIMILDEVKMC